MKSSSMRTSLLLTIIIMGMMSIGFTLFTGEIYLQQTLDNNRESFAQVVEIEVHNRWDKLKEEATSLGLSIQSSKVFRTAFAEKNKAVIAKTLNEHFHRGYVTLGVLDLKKLILYDTRMQMIVSSTEGEEVDADICPALFAKAMARKGAERYKRLHQACEYKEQLRLLTLVPVGGLHLGGYLVLVIDPLQNLAKAEDGIGFPLTITNTQGGILYRSEKWPRQYEMNNVMLVHYANKAGNKKPVAYFDFASDVTELNEKLFGARISLIIIVVLVTLVAMIIAMALFRNTIIIPLESITDYFNKIRFDKKALDEDFEVSGSKELVDLSIDLNDITKELSRLYHDFETMAFTDALTGIPNRALLFDRLKQACLFANREGAQSNFMLLMMDLNKFKAVNDELGHHIGDSLLVSVAERLQQAVRESDTIARLGGDEFAAILYAVTDKQEAIRVADKMTALMNELFEIEGYKIEVGMSIGIARYPHDGTNSETIMQHADMAMYHAKRNKLSYVFYESLVD